MKNNKHVNPQTIPAKRYFSLEEACDVIGVQPEQLLEWQRQSGGILGKGSQTLTRLDVLKLRQLQYGISDYFAREALDSEGNPVISANEMRDRLTALLTQIDKTLAN
ncbi:hypothetical protein QG034_07715 [Kingella kingae]|uniref:hypothetical protein n=1 Tax=Kingella kingae TaxID=504 RepID=UPI0003F7539B|nr:hypothetical protein [Kingella kingae]MDK4525489.1 hypothetical protein [Kingella kingae]MDK4531054.1 hypothetical protein [Kingella kingae]MDK4532827.1 hypothetical protein [Kingella kingae]MDK4535546.1 hypothetical protein [Kingella kingae]MDK4538462.1 hypothetical protein [Kingella kingae]